MTTFVAESQYLTWLKEEGPRVFQVISINSHQKAFLQMKTNLSQIQFKFENTQRYFHQKAFFMDESDSQSSSIKIREHYWL